MPRIRGEAFRRTGANADTKGNRPVPKINSSASNHLPYSPQPTDGSTILHSSNNDATNSVPKDYVTKERRDTLQNITPHEIKGSHRTKSRSRSRKKKRNNEMTILCTDDSTKLFQDAGGISQSHDALVSSNLVKSPICASSTPAAKKSPQDKDVTSNEIDFSQVTPD